MIPKQNAITMAAEVATRSEIVERERGRERELSGVNQENDLKNLGDCNYLHNGKAVQREVHSIRRDNGWKQEL